MVINKILAFVLGMPYIRHLQIQTGYDLSINTAINLPYPQSTTTSYIIPPFKQKYILSNISFTTIYHLPNCKSNTSDKFVLKTTCIESTGLPCLLVRHLDLHFNNYLLEVG